jgi:Putative prokaryotic signal transducing protein
MTRLVASTTDRLLAMMWRDLLESAGIDAQVTGAASSVYPGLPQLGEIGVIVRDEDYDEARRLLEEAQTEPDQPGPDVP